MADDLQYGLTLHQPWATCVAHHGKPIENRGWLPPERVIGRRIAIHAGKRLDRLVARSLEEGVAGCPRLGVLLTDVPLGAIVAVARVRGWVSSIEPRGWSSGLTEDDFARATGSPWFVGPVGWVLGDVKALSTPIPATGRQGLWRLPDRIRDDVLHQVAA